MIQKTFYDDNPEDRQYVNDYWSWLREQPQDAWLLWARWANWDNADQIFEAMLDRPDCDLALVSWLFWKSDPATVVENPSYYRPGALIRMIVEKVNQGHYQPTALFYDRYEVAMQAHQYVKALRRAPAGQVPFVLPRVLCGPFKGRAASLPSRYDDQTEQDLTELFDYLNGGLPRTEAEHRMSNRGTVWLAEQMRLPDVPAEPITDFRHLDDADYVEAVFGNNREYDAALDRHRRGAPPQAVVAVRVSDAACFPVEMVADPDENFKIIMNLGKVYKNNLQVLLNINALRTSLRLSRRRHPLAR